MKKSSSAACTAYPPDSHPRASFPLDQTAFRIVSKHYPPFDGGGAYRFGSRWVSPGRWVIHAAQTYSLAVLENLVHWQTASLPPNLVFIQITIPETVTQQRITMTTLATEFANDDAISRRYGDQWYDAAETAVLWVPSVVSPFESNLLINQHHPDTRQLQISAPKTPLIDARLIPTQR